MKLHLGCGKRYLPGFVHVDQVKHDHVDHVCDVRQLPFEDESVDLIYASHVIEYFDQHEVVGVLKEWRRVLKPNIRWEYGKENQYGSQGICRVSVPDFDKLIRLYQFTGNMRHMLGPIYGRIHTGFGKSPSEPTYGFHRCAYNEEYLTDRFLAAGFSSVQRWNPWTDLPEDFDDFSKAMFPHMDFSRGIAMSLNLVGIK